MMRDDDTTESSSLPGNDGLDQPGQRLAEVRKRQGRSLQDIAITLKLPRSVVEAIEADRMDSIAPIYRRGYLLNYARALGEPPEAYLNADIDAPPALKGVMPIAPQPRVDRYLRYATYFLGTTLIVPPLVYFFVAGGSRLFDDAAETAMQASTSAAEIESPQQERTAVSRRIARALSIDDADVQPGADEGPLAASTLPLPALRPAEPSVSLEESESTPASSNQPSAVEPSPLHRVDLELVEDSWVEISDAGGQRLEFDLLRAGTEASYEGLPPFRVLFGRASAVRVALDGQAIRFEGDDSGGVAEFTLEPASAEPPRERPTVAESGTP